MSRVLVVDDDAWAQRMLAAVLSQVGHQVGMAADGREGLLAAEHVRPELLIVKTRLPGIDGWELVGRLRARPELAAVPALFLVSGQSPPARRGPSFRPETDDVLIKPFSAEALQEKVERLLFPGRPEGEAGGVVQGVGEALAGDVQVPRASKPPAPTRQEPSGETRTRRATPAAPRSPVKRPIPAGIALVGRLDEFGAASILMLLELERRSGVLILSSPTGNGRAHVRKGRVLRATIEGRGDLVGPAAVFQMLTWNGGRFEFHPGEVEGEDEVRSSTSFLLLEAARKQDEEAAAQKKAEKATAEKQN
jgi:CheY-like chemotaxis protein